MTTFVYGYDPICGWCYGAAPAVRAVAELLPVRVVMAGLVVGPRVGPSANMEDYIISASVRLEAVTGRKPSAAFFDWLRKDTSIAASAPPAVAVHAVMQHAPDNAAAFAHALTEAHYRDGLDPNDPDAYSELLAAFAPDVTLPDIHDPDLAQAAFAEGRRIGLRSFPTFYLEQGNGLQELPTLYDPSALVDYVSSQIPASA